MEYRYSSRLGTSKSKTLEIAPYEENLLISNLASSGYSRFFVGGGEPLVRPDIFDLLHTMKKKKLEVRLETNGSLITDSLAKKMCNLNIDSLSLTLDSLNAEYHSFVRGPLKPTIKGLDNLLKAGFTKIHINTTISKKNFREIPKIISFLRRKGIDSVSLQPIYIPRNHNLFSILSLRTLSPQDRKEFFLLLDWHGKIKGDSEYREYINRIKGCFESKYSKRSECPMSRECLTLDPFGNLFACPHRMKESFIGNAVSKDLSDILFRYENVLQKLQGLNCIDERCVGFHPHTPTRLDIYRSRMELED